jgi:hypothetical protein
VILLANADLGEKLPIIKKIFSGTFNDYSYDWYGNVGNQIVVSMIINAICPIIEHWIEMIIYWLEYRTD